MKIFFIIKNGDTVGSRPTLELAKEYLDQIAKLSPDITFGIAELIYCMKYTTVKTYIKEENL